MIILIVTSVNFSLQAQQNGGVCVGGGGGVGGGSTGWNEKLHNGSNIRDQSDDLSHYEWIFYHENEY